MGGEQVHPGGGLAALTPRLLQTSVLCKAAVHAGVVADEVGGQVTLTREKGITLYESAFANGLHSKRWARGVPAATPRCQSPPGGGFAGSLPYGTIPDIPPSLLTGALSLRSVSYSTKVFSLCVKPSFWLHEETVVPSRSPAVTSPCSLRRCPGGGRLQRLILVAGGGRAGAGAELGS